MKNSFLIINILFSLYHYSFAYELIDAIHATVDGIPIYYSQTKNKLNSQNLNMIYPSKEDAPILEKVLNQKINYLIIENYMKFIGYEITENKLNLEYNNLMRLNSWTKKDMERYLASKNQTVEGFKSDLLNNLYFKQLLGFMCITISDQSLETYFISQMGSKNVTIVDIYRFSLKIENNDILSKNILADLKLTDPNLVYNKYKNHVDLEFNFLEDINLNNIKEKYKKEILKLNQKGSCLIIDNNSYIIFYLKNKTNKEVTNVIDKRQKEILKTELYNARYKIEINNWLKKRRKESQIKIMSL